MAWQQFSCPHCRKAFRCDVEPSSRQTACPACKHVVPIPAPTAPRWYHARNRRKVGPFPFGELRRLAASGQLTPADMVLQEGAAKWLPAATVPGLFPAQADAPPRRRARLPFVLAGVILAAVAGVVVVLAQRDGPPAVTVPPEPQVSTHPDPPKKNPPTRPPTPPPKLKDDLPPDLAGKVLARLNAFRAAAGATPIALAAGRSAGCTAHARYLLRNARHPSVQGDGSRDENPALPGFSDEGRKAARVADVVLAEPLAAVADLTTSVAGRAALLDPDLRTVGVGCAATEDGAWANVLDLTGDRGDSRAVVYPADGQDGVPLTTSGGSEVPGFVPGKAVNAGYPVTVTFAPGLTVRGVEARLGDGAGREVEVWRSTPETPAHPRAQRNSVCLIAKQPLQADTAYRVRVRAEVDGQGWTRDWTFRTAAGGDANPETPGKILARLNDHRRLAGLAPVALDADLSKGCRAHAHYLARNADHASTERLGVHEETPKLPGYSDEGRQAGKASVITLGHVDPLGAVDGWMATFYHRVPLLAPGLKRIGFGHTRHGGGWITVLDTSRGRERGAAADVVLYPAPGQKGVPLAFPSDEEPNPIPEDRTGRAGYPVTATFPAGSKVTGARFTLEDASGREVPVWFSSPEKPANPRHARQQGTTVCLIAKKPLRPATAYTVRGAGAMDGRPWTRTWVFTTGVAAAGGDVANEVHAQVNACRRTAGLPPVALDATLTKGCAAHAAYLVRNADHPTVSGGSVHREDPALPGYSVEGAEAGRGADVLSRAPTPQVQVDDLLATFFRRVYLLDPGLKRIGFGCAQDVGRGWVCVLDLVRGCASQVAVVYPAPDQKDVLATSRERDADGKDRPTGYPITVSFPRHVKLDAASVKLRDDMGQEVEGRLTRLEAGRTALGLVPAAPLRPSTAYTVTASAVTNGRVWRQTWRFTTGAPGS